MAPRSADLSLAGAGVPVLSVVPFEIKGGGGGGISGALGGGGGGGEGTADPETLILVLLASAN